VSNGIVLSPDFYSSEGVFKFLAIRFVQSIGLSPFPINFSFTDSCHLDPLNGTLPRLYENRQGCEVATSLSGATNLRTFWASPPNATYIQSAVLYKLFRISSIACYLTVLQLLILFTILFY